MDAAELSEHLFTSFNGSWNIVFFRRNRTRKSIRKGTIRIVAFVEIEL
jgi:hypothetical protein